MQGLTFGQTKAVLARYAFIHPDREDAFVARLKQWQKQPHNFPQGTNVGKGGRAIYGADQFFQLAFLLDLIRSGLTPERGILLINMFWNDISAAIYDTLVCHAGMASHRHYFSISINSLGNLQVKDHPGKLGIYLSCGCFTETDFRASYKTFNKELSDEAWQMKGRAKGRLLINLIGNIVIEMDSHLSALWRAFRDEGIDPKIFSRQIRAWGETADQATTRLHGPFTPMPEREYADDPQMQSPVFTRRDRTNMSLAALGLEQPEDARNLEPDPDTPPITPDSLRNRWPRPMTPKEGAEHRAEIERELKRRQTMGASDANS